MKSFGVRLGAGAVTILFGAYAAALAQKDRQDESDSWTAESPAMNQPAAPIAEFGGDSWLREPAMELADEPGGEPSFRPKQPAGSVQLVQHTEPHADDESPEMPMFAPGTPATLSVPEDESADAGPDASWLMPAPADHASAAADEDAAAGVPRMAMTFPGVPGAADESESTVGDRAEAPAAMTLSDAPSLEFYPADSMQAEETVSVGDGTHADVSSGASISDTSIVDSGSAAALGATAAAPANLLRGAPEGVNVLRGDEGGAFAEESELAFESDASESPAAFAEAPSASFGPSPFAQPEPQGEPHPTAAGDLAQHDIGLPARDPGFPQQGAFGPGTVAGLGAPQPTGIPAGSDAMSGVAMTEGGLHAGAPRTASLPQGASTSLGNAGNDYQPRAMQAPGAAVAIDPAATQNSPGERRLEGAQTPSIVIQKRAPAEVKVGKPASFVVHVQNVGAVEALNVEVHDQVPAGMRLVDASPTPIQQGSRLLWELGSMPAGDERTITIQLVPEQEGELGSVARVSFEAAASVRTLATRPELKIVQRVPEQGVLIGQQLEIELEVSNPGSGAATNVVLQEDVPEGLEHPKGRQLDNALGTLAPGEVRNQVLRLRAVSPGVIQNTIRLVGDDGLSAEHTVAVQVVAPDLEIELAGPSKRFLERQATYQLNVANKGTADATNVEISVQLDRGFTFVSTDYEGQYDPARHAVFWSLAQLPAGASGSVPLTLLPVEAGEQLIKTEARADLGVMAKNERTMTVEGFAELTFAISNPGGPIEVGAETTYEVHVTNAGSKADSNVRVQLQLPPGLELVSADGEAQTDGRGLIAFQPRTQLAPGQDLKYSLRVRGVAPGTHIVRAVVVSDQGSVPVTKEESTRVYADQ